MQLFWKAVILSIAASILSLQVCIQNKEWQLLIILCAAVMIASAAAFYLSPVLQLLQQLADIGDIHEDYLHILLKALGVGLCAEIAGNVVSDCGNTALAKVLQFLASAVVLSLSVPMLSSLIDLIQIIFENA